MTADRPRHPTGGQHELRWGGQRAVVVQVGGGLREYEVDGFPVLDGYGADEMASGGRGQVLIPWPNRLGDGRYRFAGQCFQVPQSEPALANAIHGLVRWSAWERAAGTSSSVRMAHVLWPQPGYPFTLALEAAYELSDAGLTITLTAENAGTGPAPYGAGQHPYVRPSPGGVDGCVLRVPAERRLEVDERQLPTGRQPAVAGSEHDFREPRAIGATRLDTAFTGLVRDADGLARVEVASGDGSRRVAVWLDRGCEYVMVFTGDTLAPAARRRSLAVEPMTCAPDAFRSGLGLQVLQPGERTSARWGIQVLAPRPRS